MNHEEHQPPVPSELAREALALKSRLEGAPHTMDGHVTLTRDLIEFLDGIAKHAAPAEEYGRMLEFLARNPGVCRAYADAWDRTPSDRLPHHLKSFARAAMGKWQD